MADSTSLEQRVAELERQVAELKAMANGAREPDWRRTIGMFTDDDGMQEIFAEAMKYREADREKARRKWAREDRAKAKKAQSKAADGKVVGRRQRVKA